MNLLSGVFGVGAALTPAFVAVLAPLSNPTLVFLVVLGACLARRLPSEI